MGIADAAILPLVIGLPLSAGTPALSFWRAIPRYFGCRAFRAIGQFHGQEPVIVLGPASDARHTSR